MIDINVIVLSHSKEELALAADKQLWVISTIMLFKNSYSTKELKNRAILDLNNIVYVALWLLVTYSNFKLKLFHMKTFFDLRYLLLWIQ